MNKEQFIEELRNLAYSAWVAGEPWNQFGFSWDKDELHFLVGDRVFVVSVDEYSYEELVKAYRKEEPGPVTDPGSTQDS